MRMTLAAAVASFAILGATVAAQVSAAIQKHTDIPEQTLGDALRTLADTRGVQFIVLSDDVETRHTSGAVGDLTVDETLKKLLKGSGLEYRYVDNKTISIYHPGAPHSTSQSTRPSNTGSDASESSSPWDRFRVAQTNQYNAGNSGSTGVARTSDVPTGSPNSSTNSARSADLEEIMVTAQKREEKLQDVPISISVLSGNALDQSTFVDTKDALATIPSLATFTHQNSGGTMLSLRGVSASGGLFAGSSPIGYYVDGVPFGLVRSAIVPDTDLYDLQRIEVLSGPQGTLYGASALNGVVRILTNDADLHDFDFKARATSSTTDHGGDNYDGDMAVNIPIVTDKLAMRVVAGDEHVSGWINSAYGNHTNDIDIGNERIKLDAQPTDSLSIGLSAWHSQVRAGGPPEADSDYYIDQTHGQPYVNTFNAYGLTVKQDTPWFDISSTSSYLVYDDRGNLDTTPVDFDFNLLTDIHSRVYSEELNLTSKTDGPWKWSAGGFYRNAQDINYETETFYPAPPVLFAFWRDTSKSEAVFGELGRSFFDDQFEITAGARYFHDDEGTQAYGSAAQINYIASEGYPTGLASATASVWTPRATLSWKATQDLTAYVSYGQGFRAGFPQGYLSQGVFPPAKPDKLTNYEVGIKGDALDHRLTYTAAGYYIHWTGVQQELDYYAPSGPTKDIGVIVVANANVANGPGAEFSVSARPLKGLDVSASFSWNDLTYGQTVYSDITSGAPLFLKGDRLDLSPKYTGFLSTSYSFPLGPSGFEGQIAASEQYISVLNSVDLLLGSEANAPSNSMLIARANFTVTTPDHWAITIFADNLANYNGAIAASAATPQWDTRVPPRTVGVRLDYHLR